MFDTALLESRRDRRGRGKGVSLPLAIGLHVAVVGTFVGAAVWNTGEPPEPVTPVIFFPGRALLATPATALPAGGGAVRTGGEKAANVRVEPREIPDDLTGPKDASDTGIIPIDNGLDGQSSTAGPGTGTPGFPGGTDPGGGTGQLGAGEIFRPGGDVRAPVLIQRVEPEYPETARRARMEGVVILEAVIDASGRVEDLRILKSANSFLDGAVERAVRQWRYRPATLNGRTVSVYLTVTVTFGLKS